MHHLRRLINIKDSEFMLLSYNILINKTFKKNMQEMNERSTEKKLFELAQDAQKKAYAPYSLFAVGAAIEGISGNFYQGCNVENVSYPVGTCAEAGAISAMINGGDRKIKRILILGSGKNLITPCGACLQRIKEFSDDSTLILLADENGIQKRLKITEMLPYGFANLE